MTKDAFEALVKIRKLHEEPSDEEEIKSLVASGKVRLIDAENSALSIESRFDLAYNAAHALALAALRQKGYRSSTRYLVFQCLEQTLGIPPEQWRILDSAHRKRNNAEYEGVFDVSEDLVTSMIKVTYQMLLLLEA